MRHKKEMRIYLIEYLDEHVGWYLCIQRAENLAYLIERLKSERITYRLKGEITKKPA